MNSKHASKHKRHHSGIKGFKMVLTSCMSRSSYVVVTFFSVCLFEPSSLSKVWVIKGCEGNPAALLRIKIGQLTLLARFIILIMLAGEQAYCSCAFCIPGSTLQDFLEFLLFSSKRLDSNISWEVSSDGNGRVGLTVNYRVRSGSQAIQRRVIKFRVIGINRVLEELNVGKHTAVRLQAFAIIYMHF